MYISVFLNSSSLRPSFSSSSSLSSETICERNNTFHISMNAGQSSWRSEGWLILYISIEDCPWKIFVFLSTAMIINCLFWVVERFNQDCRISSVNLIPVNLAHESIFIYCTFNFVNLVPSYHSVIERVVFPLPPIPRGVGGLISGSLVFPWLIKTQKLLPYSSLKSCL